MLTNVELSQVKERLVDTRASYGDDPRNWYEGSGMSIDYFDGEMFIRKPLLTALDTGAIQLTMRCMQFLEQFMPGDFTSVVEYNEYEGRTFEDICSLLDTAISAISVPSCNEIWESPTGQRISIGPTGIGWSTDLANNHPIKVDLDELMDEWTNTGERMELADD